MSEILFVIAILALLLAILLPVFFQARKKSHQAVCLSNERQMGAALLVYAQDADGSMVPAINNSAFLGAPAFWPQILRPYIKTDLCFVCPDGSAINGTMRYPFGQVGPSQVNYAYNFNIGGLLLAGVRPEPTLPYTFQNKTLAQVLFPATTVMLTDAGSWPTRDASTDWPEQNRPAFILRDAVYVDGLKANETAAPSARHAGLADVLFADGHVKGRRIESFYIGVDDHAPGELYPGVSPCLDPNLGCPQSEH